MNNPVLWLCLSFALVAVSLTAVFVVLIPAVVELSRAARSFEKLCNTLDRDLPPTLDSLRQTTAEITRLTDDVNTSVQNAGRVAQQVDHSVSSVRSQAKRAQMNTRSLMAGLGAAWATFNQADTPGNGDRSPRSPNGHHQPSSSHLANATEASTATANSSPADASKNLEESTATNTEEPQKGLVSDRDKISPASETSMANDYSPQVKSD